MFQENGDGDIENGLHRGVQYPFSVNEKVFIKVSVLLNEFIANIWFPFKCPWLKIYSHDMKKLQGNKRTPEKFVGKEAVITSQCLNGW